MKITFALLIRVVALCTLCVQGASVAWAVFPQHMHHPAAQVSDAERKAAQKINDAKDLPAKMQAAQDFISKYPKSSLRKKVADLLTQQIAGVKDNAQKLSLAESFKKSFTEADEVNQISPILIDAYVAAKRVEEAFNVAKPWLERNPNEADMLYLLAITGSEEARRQNSIKFIESSQQYGLKAIELIEADKRPESISVERWNKNKVLWLPQLYQAMGLLAALTGHNADALSRLQKAVALVPNDPTNYVLLSSVKNDEYTTGAKQLQSMPEGAAKTERMKKLTGELDEIIDLMAHAIGLMEGKPEYQQLREQLLPDLTNYYKFRHANSAAGLQELINKYKPATMP